jgi:hypothetical protein
MTKERALIANFVAMRAVYYCVLPAIAEENTIFVFSRLNVCEEFFMILAHLQVKVTRSIETC